MGECAQSIFFNNISSHFTSHHVLQAAHAHCPCTSLLLLLLLPVLCLQLQLAAGHRRRRCRRPVIDPAERSNPGYGQVAAGNWREDTGKLLAKGPTVVVAESMDILHMAMAV
jgi:hypothetical protein